MVEMSWTQFESSQGDLTINGQKVYLASHELLQSPSEQKVTLGKDSHSTAEQFFTKKERPRHQVLSSHAGSLNLDSSHSPIYS